MHLAPLLRRPQRAPDGLCGLADGQPLGQHVSDGCGQVGRLSQAARGTSEMVGCKVVCILSLQSVKMKTPNAK